MPIARRNFLKSATMTTLSAGFALGSANLIFSQQARTQLTEEPERQTRIDLPGDYPIPLEAQQDLLSYFSSATFRPYVGDLFQAPNALGEMIELKLTHVTDYKTKSTTRIATRKAQPTQSFSLTFDATEQLPPFTSIHRVSHPALGEFGLFLTTNKLAGETYVHDVVFNHMKAPANAEW
jgi:hypothetical protein